MNAIDQSPFFLPPHRGEAGGVDYLGLRTINLDLMDRLLPGLNNVANRIRPFSLLAWTIWAYEDNHRQHGTALNAEEYVCFREKIEALYILTHQLCGISLTGVAGSQRRENLADTLTLKFSALGRQQSNTLINAVNYGPGLKGDGGYRFAYPHPQNSRLFFVNKEGERLALAFDKHLLRRLPAKQYEFLRAHDDFDFQSEEAHIFCRAWNIEKPSREERNIFFSRFYPAASDDVQEQRRVATLDLITAALAWDGRSKAIRDIRRTMTMSNDLGSSDKMIDAQRSWRVLQLRQAQRLGLESLFGYIERCIWLSGTHDTRQFASEITQAVKRARPTWRTDHFLSDRLNYFSQLAASCEELFEQGWHNTECDIVTLSEEIAQGMAYLSVDDDIVAKALDLIILVVVHTEHFIRSAELRKYINHGASHRLPLDAFAIMVRSRSGDSLDAFLEQLVETLVAQHLGTAASRSSQDSSRMRLSIDDAGISSLLLSEMQCWSPTLTLDRLLTALSLLCECRKIEVTWHEEEDAYYYTAP